MCDSILKYCAFNIILKTYMHFIIFFLWEIPIVVL